MAMDIHTGQEAFLEGGGGQHGLVIIVPSCHICGDDQVIYDALNSHFDTVSHRISVEEYNKENDNA